MNDLKLYLTDSNFDIKDNDSDTDTDVDSSVSDFPVDETKKAFAKVLEFITNTFYKTNDNDNITIELSKKGMSSNFYDTTRIVLSEGLIDAFGSLNLPRFLAYYHELGHHLYSKGIFDLEKVWKRIKQGPLTYDKKYNHLLNWIEDFYIEDKLVKEHPYLTDVMNCIKKLPPDYDINKIEYAFNFWYINQAATPALNYTDQLAFKAYITRLLNLRSNSSTRFGQGILTTVSIKQSAETKFVLLLIEFYNWCVSKGIFPKNQPLPKLQNPNNHLEQPDSGNSQQDNQQDNQQSNQQSNQQDNANDDANDNANDTDTNQQANSGTHTEHSRQVGKGNPNGYEEVPHIKSPTTVFKEELVQENKLIRKELLDMSQRLQVENTTLDGLFNMRYRDSSIIQPKVIVPNFFNPNRIVDQVLFKEKEHSYMNVAIYRDISGSTSGAVHSLMSDVCEQLYKDIPVDITYYLYASGDISIVEMPYITWKYSDKVPPIYASNPLFQQLNGGTNSSAIADVITQQLSEKWLNIIITDGDLVDLMARDNIRELLKNVFVIAVHSDVEDGLLGVSIMNTLDLEKINPVLSGINLR